MCSKERQHSGNLLLIAPRKSKASLVSIMNAQKRVFISKDSILLYGMKKVTDGLSLVKLETFTLCILALPKIFWSLAQFCTNLG